MFPADRVIRRVIPFKKKRIFLGARRVADVNDAPAAPPAFPNSSECGRWSLQLELARGKTAENNEAERNALPAPSRWPSRFFHFPPNRWEKLRKRKGCESIPGWGSTPRARIPLFSCGSGLNPGKKKRSTERLQEGVEAVLEMMLSRTLHMCVTDSSQICTWALLEAGWALQGTGCVLLRPQPLPLSSCQALPAMLLHFLRARGGSGSTELGNNFFLC